MRFSVPFPIILYLSTIGAQAQEVASQGILYRRSYFYAGGTYVPQGDSSIMQGAMYVEHLVPQHVTQPLPLLVIHGHGMTGTNFLNTPDGRPGWADFFLGKGYELYIVDQPVRGRSPFHIDVDGPQSTDTTLRVQRFFTAAERFKLWPQAILHTQWPGNGSMGDPIFDRFYASTVPSLVSNEETSTRIRTAGSALLDQIGPVNLLAHSQGGPLGWVLADSRPNLVKSIISIEPAGPPFINAIILDPTVPTRPFGITDIPVEYSPPLSSPEDLKRVAVSNSSLFTCFEQASPPRKLVNLMKMPHLVVTSESGFNAVYDDCTVNYLKQAGVEVKHLRLEDVGIRGNGHMMFMEKNSVEVAELLENWISKASRK